MRTLGCADLSRIMASSQLTWRESLRDIAVCLEANQAKLFHIATPPARSTLHCATLTTHNCERDPVPDLRPSARDALSEQTTPLSVRAPATPRASIQTAVSPEQRTENHKLERVQLINYLQLSY